ncbi:MAG: hypothetical protein L3K19_06560 [Thermoplasmata archaeon]|nr:hypothetical protein [Thermoplasmata archaeon]
MVFVAIDWLWSAGAFGVELALGDRLLAHRSPDTSKNAADALWHVATALVIALPSRRVYVWVAAPAFALALDVDHLFGAVLPTVVIRSAHDVFFIGLFGVVLLIGFGRPAALVAVGAVLEHIAVDGGGFPLFAPITTTYYVLPFPAQVALIGGAAFLLFAALRPVREFRSVKALAQLGGASLVLAAGLWFLWPYVSPFTHG